MTSPAMRLPADLRRALNSFADAHHDCGNWRSDDSDETYAAVSQRAEAAEEALATRLVRLVKLERLGHELLEHHAEEFDGPPDEDLQVSGSDLVDWFSGFREKIRRALGLKREVVRVAAE